MFKKAENSSKGHVEVLQMNACPWVRSNCSVSTPTAEQMNHVGFCMNAWCVYACEARLTLESYISLVC